MLQRAPPPMCTPTGGPKGANLVDALLLLHKTRKKEEANEMKGNSGARGEGSPKGEWMQRVINDTRGHLARPSRRTSVFVPFDGAKNGVS